MTRYDWENLSKTRNSEKKNISIDKFQPSINYVYSNQPQKSLLKIVVQKLIIPVEPILLYSTALINNSSQPPPSSTGLPGRPLPKRRGSRCCAHKFAMREVTHDDTFNFSVCRFVIGRNSIKTRYFRVFVYLFFTLALCVRVNLAQFELSSVCACIVRKSTHKRTYVHTQSHVCVHLYASLCVCL